MSNDSIGEDIFLNVDVKNQRNLKSSTLLNFPNVESCKLRKAFASLRTYFVSDTGLENEILHDSAIMISQLKEDVHKIEGNASNLLINKRDKSSEEISKSEALEKESPQEFSLLKNKRKRSSELSHSAQQESNIDNLNQLKMNVSNVQELKKFLQTAHIHFTTSILNYLDRENIELIDSSDLNKIEHLTMVNFQKLHETRKFNLMKKLGQDEI